MSRNFFEEYKAAIDSGEITVGEHIKSLYDRIEKGLAEGLFFLNLKKANKAIKFIENFCHHCEGRNDLIKLEPWQKATVTLIFGIVDENNIRFFRECVIVIGRKKRKDAFCVRYYCLYELY